MTNPFATALAAQFASAMAVAAVYTSAGEPPFSLRVIRTRGSEESGGRGGSYILDVDIVEIMRSDVEMPLVGDAIMIGAEMFTISEAPLLDVEGMTWRCGIANA